MEIKPFSKLPLTSFFRHDLEKINMAYRLSGSIQSGLKNIRAAGDEVEFAVRNFFHEKLYPKYHVCDGHIIDSSLKASPQFDIIICENSKNPVLFDLADKSQLVYYETVYCYGEIKKSFYNPCIFKDFSDNLQRLNHELKRDAIPPNFIECAQSGFQVAEPLTKLPLRNPLLTFVFLANSSALRISQLEDYFSNTPNEHLPNFITLLDQGLVLNINKEKYSKRELEINLYPAYEKKDSQWILLPLSNDEILLYQYLLILEHLNNSVLKTPEIRQYTKGLFDIALSRIQEL